MSFIGTLQYVITVQDGSHNTRFYCGKIDNDGKKPRLTSELSEAKVYDDEDVIWDELDMLRAFPYAYGVIELQSCPKCHKCFVEYPAISREDNITEICPECGAREAMEAFKKAVERRNNA